MRRRSCFYLAMCFGVGAYGQTITPRPHAATIVVPTLVEVKSGEIAYGIPASDFLIRDDGIEQRVEVDDSLQRKPLSLLLVIQTGHNAAEQLGKIAHLNDLLDSILTSPHDQVGILTFDTRPHMIQAFTTRSSPVSASLSSIHGGDAGAGLFDAMHLAITSFDKEPGENRRIILLISGEHDHGSNAWQSSSLIRAVSSSNVSIYSLSFASKRKEPPTAPWSANPLAMTANAVQANAGESLSRLTGGEFYRFDTIQSFDDTVLAISKHIHNRYNLAFQPSNPQPGFHSLQVEIQRPKANVVAARSGYWLSSCSGPKRKGSE